VSKLTLAKKNSMPMENINILFRPVHFFTENPAMDVPGANDTHSGPAFPNSNGAAACCSQPN
jgi:primary-amine oxidase